MKSKRRRAEDTPFAALGLARKICAYSAVSPEIQLAGGGDGAVSASHLERRVDIHLSTLAERRPSLAVC